MKPHPHDPDDGHDCEYRGGRHVGLRPRRQHGRPRLRLLQGALSGLMPHFPGGAMKRREPRQYVVLEYNPQELQATPDYKPAFQTGDYLAEWPEEVRRIS